MKRASFFSCPFVAGLLVSVGLCITPTKAEAQSADKAVTDRMIVFDASGSMWGQIDGEAKITIARRVMGDLLSNLPDKGTLGLAAYGHRVKGDCSDIEILVPPAPMAPSKRHILSTVEAINPKGKTPLSAAVIAAAQALRHTENAATVVLISDGRETCDLDPCEVANRLETDGVNFTAHVIGFDVAKPEDEAQLQCLAQNTGGQYVKASNADELAKALEQVSKIDPIAPSTDDFVEEEPVPATVFFEDLFDGDSLQPHWQILNRSDTLFQQKQGLLKAVAVSEVHEFWREKALNRFVLDHDLPQGDFDLKLDFSILAPLPHAEAVVGLYDPSGSAITASLFFANSGCGLNPQLFVTTTKGKDGKERQEFQLELFKHLKFKPFCERGATEPADVIAEFGKRGASLVLQKRGRDYAARLDMLWPSYRGKVEEEISVSTKSLTVLRAPKKASFMAGQRHPVRGETLLMVERFAIEEVKQ